MKRPIWYRWLCYQIEVYKLCWRNDRVWLKKIANEKNSNKWIATFTIQSHSLIILPMYLIKFYQCPIDCMRSNLWCNQFHRQLIDALPQDGWIYVNIDDNQKIGQFDGHMNDGYQYDLKIIVDNQQCINVIDLLIRIWHIIW